MLQSIGDLALTFSNRLSNVRIRTEMNTLATELTTGRKSDIRTPLSGDLTPVAVIERSLSNLAAYGTVISESALFLSGVQSGLSQIADQVQSLARGAIDMENTNSPSFIANFARDAASRFEAIVSTLNGSIAGRSLFAGNDTSARPVAAASLILDDLVAGLPPGARATDISAAVDAYFAPGAGFDTARYLGSDTAMAPMRVTPDDSLSFTVTAQTSELRTALAATAKAALLDRGILAGDTGQKGELIRQTGLDLFGAGVGIVTLRGDVGMIEGRLESARARNATEQGALQMARSALVGADPFQTATQLQGVKTQLETFYTLTARLSQLSLTRYLR